ncbi:MAG: tetratricopeptide repeat protein [Bacteroidota bacterium]
MNSFVTFFKIAAVCLFISAKGFAQMSTELSAFYNEKNLDRKAVLGNKLWDKMHQSNIDTLRQVAIELIVLGNEANNLPAIAIGKRALGSSLIRSGEPEKGLTYLKDALSFFRKTGDKTIETEILSEIGNGYLNSGQPIKAENFYLQSLKAGQESDDKTAKFMAEINLAQAYIQMKSFKKASAYLLHYKGECLKLGRLESVGSAYSLLGRIAEEEGKIPLATEYYQKSVDFGKRSKSKNQMAHALNNLAIVYFRENKSDSSLILFQQALKLRQEVGNARFIAESFFNIGGLYHELKEYSKALEYYQISLDFAKQKNLKREEMDAMMAMIEVHKATGDNNKVVPLYEQYIKLQELFYTDQSNKNMEENEVLVTIDQLEQDRKSLEGEARFQRMEQFNRTKWKMVYAAVGFLAISILGIVLLRSRRKKNELAGE